MRQLAAMVCGVFLISCVTVPEGATDSGPADSGPVDSGLLDAGAPDAGSCEGVDFQTDPNHCGGCNKSCAYRTSAFAQCAAGACQYSCLPGYGDCNQDLATPAGNGCEAALLTSAEHCGACGNTCADTRPNAAAACSAGKCGTKCQANFGDCNFDLTNASGNGCEADLRSSGANCGECWKVCTTTCGAGACAGELAECRVFGSVSARPLSVSTASDGTHVAAGWWDDDNKGLWVARLDPRGAIVTAPRKVLTETRGVRPALAFDGTSFVLGWSTNGVKGLSLQRLSKAALADEGPVVPVALNNSPLVLLATRSGTRAAFLGWSDSLQSVQLLVWPHAQAQPDAPKVVSVPGNPASGVTAFTAVRDGFVLAWVAQVPSPFAGAPLEKRLGTLTLGLDGTVAGSLADQTPSSVALQGGVALGSMGDRALLTAVEGMGSGRLRSLVFDETGAPVGGGQFAWNVLVPNFEGSLAVAGDPAGAWLLERSVTTAANELRFRRLSIAGQTVGVAKTITSTVGQPTLLPSSFGATGALGVWRRTQVGVPGALIGVAFIDSAGLVSTPCLTP
jgi:hypothetical protein